MKNIFRKSVTVFFAFIVIVILLSVRANSQEYIITDLGFLADPCENCWTEPVDINNKGEIVGYTDSGVTYKFLWTEEQGMISLDSGSGSRLLINDQGMVAGVLGGEGPVFLWTEKDGLLELGTLGIPELFPDNVLAMNKHGEIVGQSWVNWNDEHAFLATAEVGIIDLGTLYDAPRSGAYAINKKGEVVGWSDTNIVAPSGFVYQHAFLWTAKDGMTDLGTLGDRDECSPTAMNALGRVVGNSYGNLEGHAFIWQNGIITDLNDFLPAGSEWVLESAQDINGKGQIIGYGYIDGESHGFLMTPIQPNKGN